MTHRAFTLVETIVTIAITTLVSLTLGMLLVYFYRTNAYTIEQSTAVAQARRGVEDSMRYLREASFGSDGSYPIASAATSSVVFYANVDTDSSIEQVKYVLQSGTLYRVIGEPVGDPLTYVGETYATSTIATNVVNATSTPVFLYFDNTGTQISTPINIASVTSVRTTLVVDVNINRAPISFTLSGGATLRNIGGQL